MGHEQTVMQEDGSEKTVTVNESEAIKMAGDGKKHPNGLWIGKMKYQITRSQPMDFNGTERTFVMCNRPKAGAILCKTADSIVIALYAEEKGQVAGNASKAMAAFVQYLADNA